MARFRTFLSAGTTDYKLLRDQLAECCSQRGITIIVQKWLRENGRPTLNKLEVELRDMDCVVHIVGPTTGGIADQSDVDDLLHRLGGESQFLARPGRTTPTWPSGSIT